MSKKQKDKAKSVLAWVLVAVIFLGVAFMAFRYFMPECEHEFVDGKCTECGIDECEEHKFVDGKCEECGLKESTADEGTDVAYLPRQRYSFRTLNTNAFSASAMAFTGASLLMATSVNENAGIATVAATDYGKVTFTDNSNEESQTLDFVLNVKPEADAYEGSQFVYSWYVEIGTYKSTTWTGKTGDCFENGGHTWQQVTNTTHSVNVQSLIDDGHIVAGETYTVKAVVTPFETYDWGGNNWQFTQGTAQTQNLGTFTLQTVSDLPTPPTKTGYTFNGWYTDEACTQRYTNDKVIGNITLYAGFTANTYSIKFDSNGGTGSMANLAMTYDQSKNLTANTFSKDKYHFKGWSTTKGGAVAYNNAASVKNLSATNGATVTLYAVWEINTYSIKFDSNGGSGTMSNLAMTCDTAKTLTANSFVKTNYHFRGWSTTKNGAVAYADKASVKNLTTTHNGTVTLYAVWEIDAYAVTFVSEGKTVSTQNINHGSAATLPDAPTKTGYTFEGWFLADGTQYTGQAITKAQTITAKFEVIQYVVTFIVDGEVYARVAVDYGTNLAEALAAAGINTALYEMEGEDSPNF